MEAQRGEGVYKAWHDHWQMSLKCGGRWRQSIHCLVSQDGSHWNDFGRTVGVNTWLSVLKKGPRARRRRQGVENSLYSLKELCWLLRVHVCSNTWHISWTTKIQTVTTWPANSSRLKEPFPFPTPETGNTLGRVPSKCTCPERNLSSLVLAFW